MNDERFAGSCVYLPMKAWVLAVGLVAAMDAAEPAGRSDQPARIAIASHVEVTLKSDGQTWVSINNVMQPAKFQSKKVSLPPGDYTVMGRRKGYRDVEMQLQVRPGETPRALSVICTEAVR